MVDPARIRCRIARFEIDEEATARNGNVVFVDVVVDSAVKWYLGYVTLDRTFYFHSAQEDEEIRPRQLQITGRLRDYLVSILPHEIIARCIAASLGATT